jgi:hypothetical protein
MRAVPPVEDLDAYVRTAVRRVDEAAVADVDADVSEVVEEDKVSGL